MRFKEKVIRFFDNKTLPNSLYKQADAELKRNWDLAFPGGEKDKIQRTEELRSLLDYKYSYDSCWQLMFLKGTIASSIHDRKPTLDTLQSLYFYKKDMTKDDIYFAYLFMCEINNLFTGGDGFTDKSPVVITAEPLRHSDLSFKYISVLLGKAGVEWKLNKTSNISKNLFFHNVTFRQTNFNIYFNGLIE